MKPTDDSRTILAEQEADAREIGRHDDPPTDAEPIVYAVATGTHPRDFRRAFRSVHNASSYVAQLRFERPGCEVLVWSIPVSQFLRFVGRNGVPWEDVMDAAFPDDDTRHPY